MHPSHAHTERCRIRCSEIEIESATNKHWLGAVTSRLREAIDWPSRAVAHREYAGKSRALFRADWQWMRETEREQRTLIGLGQTHRVCGMRCHTILFVAIRVSLGRKRQSLLARKKWVEPPMYKLHTMWRGEIWRRFACPRFPSLFSLVDFQSCMFRCAQIKAKTAS